MRRLPTALIVATVALVGILATADALRGHEPEARSPAVGTSTHEPTLTETLREELVIGVVLYSDEECHIHVLVLPQMEDTAPLDGPDRCRFGSTDGWFLGERERLSPNWRFVAECDDDEIIVREAETGSVRRRIEGCAPAWRPQIGNRLTWARGEAVYERGRPLLNRRDLHAIARRHRNVQQLGVPFRVVVTDLSWLDVDHLILSLEIRGRYVPRDSITVLLEGKTVIGQVTTFEGTITGPSGHWFPSSAGSFAATDSGTILTADGQTVSRPNQLTRGRAVAFSPDERWLAFVTEQSIFLLGTPRNAEPGRIVRIPVPARDLAWERVTTSLTFPRPSQ